MHNIDVSALAETSDKTKVFAQVSKSLAEKHTEAQKLRFEISELENKTSAKKEELRRIEEEEMPALMDEIGVSRVTLTNGTSIVVDQSLHASIPKQTQVATFKWLRDNNHSALIKNEMVIKFNKNEDNYVGEVRKLVEDFNLDYSVKESVHSQTLKAFVKEQMRAGIALPKNLFDIFIKRIVDTK